MNKITLITLGVENLSKSKEFYTSLGFRVDEKDSDETIVFFETGETRFSLYPVKELSKDVNPTNPPKSTNGFAGIALAFNTDSKENVDILFRKVKKSGGTIQSEPHEAFWGGYRFYFSDLDGHYWEIAYA